MKRLKLFLGIGLCFFIVGNISAQWTPTPGAENVNPNSITVQGSIYLGKGVGATLNSLAVGTSMPATTSGIENTAFGASVLNANTTGSYNTGSGVASLIRNITGNNNTAYGYYSMYFNTAGGRNTAIGSTALHRLNGLAGSADSNTALGTGAIYSLLSGNANVGLGHGALARMTSGNYNIAIGGEALSGIISGNNNIGIGFNAILTSGVSDQLSIQNVIYGINMSSAANGNVAVGTVPGAFPSLPTLAKFEVGGTLKIDVVNTGSSNTFLYRNTNGLVEQGTLPTNIAASSCSTQYYVPRVNATGSNALICSQITDNGNTVTINAPPNTYNWTRPPAGQTYGQYGNAGTSYPGSASDGIITPPTTYRLYVGGWVAATGYVSLSDKRMKKNIRRLEGSLNRISRLNGYTYDWNNDNFAGKKLDENRQAGLLAQEVEEVLPEAVVKNSDGVYGLNYNSITSLLVEGIKQQQTQIETQQIKIENLELQIGELKNKLNQLVPGDVKIKINSLEVIPNPITGTSVVSYKLDNSNAAAFLIVSDLQGRLLKQISLPKNQQQGQVQVSKSDLPGGMYVFAIISGNTEVQSKKVLVSASE